MDKGLAKRRQGPCSRMSGGEAGAKLVRHVAVLLREAAEPIGVGRNLVDEHIALVVETLSTRPMRAKTSAR